MDPRSQFKIQLLEKLGAPLMRAMSMQGASANTDTAQAIAAMLSESVKISIYLTQVMKLTPEDGDADAIRVALATIAGDLVADAYGQTGRTPTDADAQKIAKALESVLAFSDNFAPATEHAQRLQTLGGNVPFIDPMQTSLYAMAALSPVISAVAEFPFGQQETKLIQDISAKLAERAKALQGTLADEPLPLAEGKVAELVILQSLGQMYAAAHRAETARLRTLPEDQRGGELSLQPVWDSLDRQIAMVEVLLSSMSGEGNLGSGRGGKGVKPAAEAPAEEAPAQPAAPAAQAPAAPPAKPANPMSFFKKT